MSEKKTYAFETAMKRSLYGEKTVLKSISSEDEEFWIIPRKFSVEGIDAYTTFQAQTKTNISKDAAKIITQKLKDGVEDIEKSLTPGEMEKILDGVNAQAISRSPMIRVFVRYGIGVHNLAGEESDKVSEELVARIMESNVLSQEIYEIVNGWNDFLSQRRSGSK
jgi:hypothetical protein